VRASALAIRDAFADVGVALAAQPGDQPARL
jgi:hypothetical protein